MAGAASVVDGHMVLTTMKLLLSGAVLVLLSLWLAQAVFLMVSYRMSVRRGEISSLKQSF